MTAIDADLFNKFEIEGKAILIHTGWDAYWNTEKYYSNHPFLTENAALLLKKKKVKEHAE